MAQEEGKLRYTQNTWQMITGLHNASSDLYPFFTLTLPELHKHTACVVVRFWISVRFHTMTEGMLISRLICNTVSQILHLLLRCYILLYEDTLCLTDRTWGHWGGFWSLPIVRLAPGLIRICFMVLGSLPTVSALPMKSMIISRNRMDQQWSDFNG